MLDYLAGNLTDADLERLSPEDRRVISQILPQGRLVSLEMTTALAALRKLADLRPNPGRSEHHPYQDFPERRCVDRTPGVK